MINLNYFKTIFPDQPRLVETVMDLTISEYPRYKRDMVRCAKNEDREGLKRLAHKWQYTAKILGLDEIWEILDQLFRTCAEMSTMELHGTVNRAIDLLDELIGELRSCRMAS